MNADPFAERLREADLDRYLATLYAPAAARPALFALHALDLELVDIVRTTTQPMIGLIRLAWWREALERLDCFPPPAQPLLQALAERLLPIGVRGNELGAIEAGMASLFEEPFDVEGYLSGRSQLFGLASRLLGGDEQAGTAAGRLWAAGELSSLRPDVTVDVPALDMRGAPRSLIGLAALARRPGPRGTPSRQLRLLWSILSGR